MWLNFQEAGKEEAAGNFTGMPPPSVAEQHAWRHSPKKCP